MFRLRRSGSDRPGPSPLGVLLLMSFAWLLALLVGLVVLQFDFWQAVFFAFAVALLMDIFVEVS